MSQRYVQASLLYKAARTLCRVFTTTLLDLKVYGVEHVPTDGGVLLLSNHQSNLDPVMVGVQLRRPVSFLAKSELFKPWGFRWLIRNLGAFPVRQGAGDVGAVRETIARLKEGRLLTVFPEGSRTHDGELMPLQTGFALIVRRAGVPIVPVAIEGTFAAWPRGQLLPRMAPVRVSFGRPLDVSDCKPAEIVDRVDAALRTLMADLRDRIRAERDGTSTAPV